VKCGEVMGLVRPCMVWLVLGWLVVVVLPGFGIFDFGWVGWWEGDRIGGRGIVYFALLTWVMGLFLLFLVWWWEGKGLGICLFVGWVGCWEG
jgi:hypothetical protein